MNLAGEKMEDKQMWIVSSMMLVMREGLHEENSGEGKEEPVE